MRRVSLPAWEADFRKLKLAWSALSLAQQFALAAVVVLGCGMTFLGAWVGNRIENGVVQNTAAGAALYINSFVGPHVRELSTQSRLLPQSVEALDKLLKDSPLGSKVLGIKVWLPDGSIVYSNKPELIGRSYPLSPGLKRAVNGAIVGEYNDLDDEENELERALGVPLLEIYSPIRALSSGQLVAVAEFYEEASYLGRAVRRARLQTWYVVALVTMAMLSVLFAIVRRGSRTIHSQQQALHDRIGELSNLLSQNEMLRRRIDDILRRSVDTNDLLLRRVGSELHDGPAQLISLGLLRLDTLRQAPGADAKGDAAENFERIRSALNESLTEIRNISAGLALPELEVVTTADAIRMAVRSHEKRYGVTARCDVTDLPDVTTALKACVYRVTQEGLNNGFRHAGGAGQAVSACEVDGKLQVQIADAGPGFDVEAALKRARGLGLIGIRDRVAALGGTLDIESELGKGTRLTMRFEIAKHSACSARDSV